MDIYDQEGILSAIEPELPGIKIPDAMPGDKWLVSSCLQKSVRRGDVDKSLQAGVALWRQDRRNFWRRLHVLSCEDIGVSSVDAVVKSLTVHENPAWRKRVDDLASGLYLIRLLCGTVKTRLCDEIYMTIEQSSDFAAIRTEMVNSTDNALADMAMNEQRSLHKRCLALWMLAGTRKFPSDLMPLRIGSIETAKEVMQEFAAPPDLTGACIGVLTRTGWPLALLTPLLWSAVQKLPGPVSIRSDPLPQSGDVEGIPFFGVDTYTRIGKTCIRHLQKSVPCMKPFSPQQIGLVLFHEEGGKLDKSLTSPELAEIQIRSDIAGAENVGLSLPDYLGLRECLSDNFDKLQQIRRNQLQVYLNGMQGELQWGN